MTLRSAALFSLVLGVTGLAWFPATAGVGPQLSTEGGNGDVTSDRLGRLHDLDPHERNEILAFYALKEAGKHRTTRGAEPEAEEVANLAWMKLSRLDGESWKSVKNPCGYIAAAVRHARLDVIKRSGGRRKAGRATVPLPADPTDRSPGVAESVAGKEAYDAMLRKLPPRHREACLARFEGLSYREIAERLEVTKKRVEKILYESRLILKASLTPPRAEPFRPGCERGGRDESCL